MLYLHCGWLRTGTTSLQTAIIGHREQLTEANIVYPDWWRPDGVTDHHGLVRIVNKRGEDAQRQLEGFRQQLQSLAHGTVIISSESLTLSVDNDKCDRVLDLFAAARTVMPITQIWTLRNFADTVKSVYHRFGITRADPPSPTEYLDRLGEEGKHLPEELFAGLLRVANTPDDTVYLKYAHDGLHSREVLRTMRLPPELHTSIEKQITNGPRLNPRLSHKGAIAVRCLEEISARAGFSIDKDELVDLFRGGQFAFDDDRPCNLFDEDLTASLHEQALAAAHKVGFTTYLEFFADTTPEISPALPIDPDLLDDGDIERLAGALRPALLR